MLCSQITVTPDMFDEYLWVVHQVHDVEDGHGVDVIRSLLGRAVGDQRLRKLRCCNEKGDPKGGQWFPPPNKSHPGIILVVPSCQLWVLLNFWFFSFIGVGRWGGRGGLGQSSCEMAARCRTQAGLARACDEIRMN